MILFKAHWCDPLQLNGLGFVTNKPWNNFYQLWQILCSPGSSEGKSTSHLSHLKGNFLSWRLIALIATPYLLPLFILKGSSTHSGLIRFITPPLLVFILYYPISLLSFPSSLPLISNQTPSKPALHLPPEKIWEEFYPASILLWSNVFVS